MVRKILFPALFFLAGVVVALAGERVISAFSGTDNETRVQAFEDWRLVCPPAVAVPAPAPPAAQPPAAAETPAASTTPGDPAAAPAAAPAPAPTPAPTPAAQTAQIPPCTLTIEVVNQQGVLVALGMNDPTSRLVVTVPHGIALEPGLGFSVGGEPMRIHPFETCTQVGCIAHVPVDAETLQLMRDSTEGQITVQPRTGQQQQPVNIPFSLNGFAEGHAALAREHARRTSSVWRFLNR
jgi:invasion protein IalB